LVLWLIEIEICEWSKSRQRKIGEEESRTREMEEISKRRGKGKGTSVTKLLESCKSSRSIFQREKPNKKTKEELTPAIPLDP